MRLPFSTLFAFNASLFSLFPVLVSAIHPHVLSHRGHRRIPESLALTSRQHHIPRDLLDVCINANVNLLANLSQALLDLLGTLGLGGDVQLCLCLKDLNLYLQTNDELQALIGLLGNQEVSAIITALINTSPDAQSCTFPDHAHHTCNNSDPCHYECDEGYDLDANNQCVCAPPNITCNGVCGSFPQGCGSAVPRSSKAIPEKIRTLTQAKAVCQSHQTVCGIPGRENTLAFECIDTTQTVDSCGGCIVPHSFLETDPARKASGADCGVIPNVERVSCSASRCVAHACQEGWKPSVSGDACIPDRSLPPRMVKILKRGTPVSVNANTTANINSDLVTYLVSIVDMILGLPSGTSSSSVPPIAIGELPHNAGTIKSLLNDVNNATDTLINSMAVSDFLFNLDVLHDTLVLLGSMLQQCLCEDGLGYSGLLQKVDGLAEAVDQLQNWCTHNPITMSPHASSPTTGANSPGVPQSENVDGSPILVGLSDLVNHLGLFGPSTAGVSVAGLGPGINEPTNDILNGLGIGPLNLKRRGPPLAANVTANVTINSAIVAQIDALLDLSTGLQGLLGSLPSVASGTLGPALDSSLVVNLDQAVNQLLQSPTIPALMVDLQAIISATTDLEHNITASTYLTPDILEGVIYYLDGLLAAATELQTMCTSSSTPSPTSLPVVVISGTTESHPHASPSSTHVVSTPGLSTSIPVIVGLDSLLADLGLGGDNADATILGLGDGLSSTADNLLDGVGIGPKGMQSRQVSANATADADISLLDDLESSGLIDRLLALVLDLNETHASLSPASSSAIDSALIDSIVNTTLSLPVGSSYADIVTDIDSVLADSTVLSEALQEYEDLQAIGLEEIYAYIVKIVDSALALQDWCNAHPTPPSPSSANHPSPPLPTTAYSSVPLPATTNHSSPAPTTIYPPSDTHGSPSPASSDEPIIVGLTKLLHGLGLDIDADVVVDGLGNNIDHSVNSITDTVGVGPDGARRRFARPSRE